MILEAAILEIKLSFFVVYTGYRQYKFVLKHFPVEATRLRNHSRPSVAGITVNTSCEVEVSSSTHCWTCVSTSPMSKTEKKYPKSFVYSQMGRQRSSTGLVGVVVL